MRAYCRFCADKFCCIDGVGIASPSRGVSGDSEPIEVGVSRLVDFIPMGVCELLGVEHDVVVDAAVVEA